MSLYLKRKKGQTLVQYAIVALAVISLVTILIPVYQESNKSLKEQSTPDKNANLNQEGVITTVTAPAGGMTPNLPGATAPTPPAAPGTMPTTPSVGDCGPNGCGTLDLPAEESICGTIPGPAGVLNDGCWICNHANNIWEWETDITTACPNYWYGSLGSTCSSKCVPHSPPFNGLLGLYCYVCTHSGSTPGYWQKRNSSSQCNDFWNSPYACMTSDVAYNVNCLCSGAPPVYGIYYEETTKTDTCWLCDGSQWINSQNTTDCRNMWFNITFGICPFSSRDDDYPFCGCSKEPPERGPDPSGTGECWICNSGNWIKETDPVKCNDFWVNDNCPDTSGHALTCGDPLPLAPPLAGHCWICTNPDENYMEKPYDASNSLYSGWGEPCDKFWKEGEYPGYIDIPNSPDNVDTVCSDSLTSQTFPEPGIVYNPSKDKWGCWLCVSGGAYTWIDWFGGRFDRIIEEEYQACHSFWIEGTYPSSIPSGSLGYERVYEYGGSGYEVGRDVIIDGDNLLIVGDESTDTTGGNTDIFVIEMDKDSGEINWKKQYGGSAEEKGQAITTGGGSIFVAGYESSHPDGGNYDAVVMKLTASGSVDWKKQYGGTGNEKAYGISYSPESGGRIYVTGSETSDSGGGNEDIFVVKLDMSGNVIWKYQYGGPEREEAFSIIYADNSIYVAGYEMSDNEGGLSDVAVMKLDAAGNVIWKYQYGGDSTDRAYAMTLSGSNLYLTGYETSDTAGGKADVFVMKLDTNGNISWKKQYGGTENDKGYAIGVEGNFVYVVGEESSDPQAGANFTGPGKKDVFVMKLASNDGSVVWKQQHGGSYDDRTWGLAAGSGYIYAVGEESSDPDGGANDLLVISLQMNQDATLGDERDLDDWTLSGDQLNWSSSGVVIDGWHVVADNLHGWTVEHNLTTWTASGAVIGSWTLEGTVIDPDITSPPPPHEEEIDWTPIVSQVTVITPPPPPPPPPTTEWKHQYGVWQKTDVARSIVAPGDGFIYVTGFTKPNIYSDIFVMKLNEDGEIVRKKHYGKIGLYHDNGFSIDYDSGKLYVTGYTNNSKDIFAMQLDSSDLSVDWAKRYKGPVPASEIGLAIEAQGNFLYVLAIEVNAFTPSNGTGLGEWYDILLMKLDKNNGNLLYVTEYGGDEDEMRYDNSLSYEKVLSVPGDGYVYIAGYEESDIVPSGTDQDIFVMKVNEPDGSIVWAKQYGGNEEDYAFSIDVSLGDIYICGSEQSDSPNHGSGHDDIFIMKINPSGNVVWTKQLGGTGGADLAYSIIVDGNDLYVTGEEDSDPAGSGSESDIFVLKLDKNTGNIQWKNQYGGSFIEVADVGYAVDIDGNNLYVTGFEKSEWYSLSIFHYVDIVVLKLDATQAGPGNITNWPTNEAFQISLDEPITHGANGWEAWGYDITAHVIVEDLTIDPNWRNGDDIIFWDFEGTAPLDDEIINNWSIGL